MNLFDILGPVMVGPSSSHTAGAVRLGRTARRLLGEGTPREAGDHAIRALLPQPATGTAQTARCRRSFGLSAG